MTRAWRLVGVALAAFACVLPGASAYAQQESEAFATGYNSLQRGEYDEAVQYFTQATQDRPNSSSAWYHFGLAQFEVVNQSLAIRRGAADGQGYSNAKIALQKAIDLAPSRPGSRYILGRIAEEEGDFAAADAAYREELGLKQLPDRNSILMGSVRVAYAQDRFQDAITNLDRILVDEPRYVEAHYYLGLSKRAMNDNADAIKSLKSGIKILNEWLDRVYHLLRVEYLESAPYEPDKASDVVNNWDQLRKELWNLRRATGRPTDSKRTLEQVTQDYFRAQDFALGLQLWPALNKALGDTYLAQKDWSAARNAYRDATEPRQGEGDPEDPDVWARIGHAYFLNGKETFEKYGQLLRAINEFEAAEGVVAGVDPSLWDGFARALNAAGYSLTTKLSDMTAPAEPDPVVASAFDGLGELYLYQANTYNSDTERQIKSHTHQEALDAFDKALLMYPGYLSAKLHKAEALIARGERAITEAQARRDFEAARKLLEKDALPNVKKNSPMQADMWAQLAKAYLNLDDLTNVERTAHEALRINKNHTLALNMLGMVKYLPPKSNFAAAAEDFSNAIDSNPLDFVSYLNLGNAMYGMRSWGRAQREYQRALELIPEASISNTGSQRPYVMFLIARAQHEQGLYDRAINTLNDVLRIRTDYWEAQRLLAASYSSLRKWYAAEEALRSALNSLQPEETVRISNTHSHLGQVYEAQAKFQDAVAEYETALIYSDKNLQARDGLQRLSTQLKQSSVATAGN